MARLDEAGFQPATSPGFLIRVIQQHSLATLDALFAEDGVTASQWIALVSIHFGEEVTCAALARGMAHDKGAMTRLIDALAERGLVERRRDDADRRLVILTLTDAGREVTQRCKRKVVAQWNTWLADWEQAEVEQFMGLLRRLRATMKASA